MLNVKHGLASQKAKWASAAYARSCFRNARPCSSGPGPITCCTAMLNSMQGRAEKPQNRNQIQCTAVLSEMHGRAYHSNPENQEHQLCTALLSDMHGRASYAETKNHVIFSQNQNRMQYSQSSAHGNCLGFQTCIKTYLWRVYPKIKQSK